MTIVDTIADEHYRNRATLAHAFATALNEEAHELAALGVDVVQFDEPAFNVYMRDVQDWGIAALERAAQGLNCTTAVHICYGYGIKANTDWKATLGESWRQYEETFPALAASRIDQVSLECRNSRVPIELIGLLKGKDVLVGCIDVASNIVETPEEVAATIRDGARVRARRTALSLHQLRHGADARADRLRKAHGAGGGGRDGAQGDVRRRSREEKLRRGQVGGRYALE